MIPPLSTASLKIDISPSLSLSDGWGKVRTDHLLQTLGLFDHMTFMLGNPRLPKSLLPFYGSFKFLSTPVPMHGGLICIA